MSSDESSGVIQSIARAGRSFPPSPAVVARALLGGASYQALYRRSVDDPEGFWAEMAGQELVWSRRWDSVLDWKPPFARWFDGGALNVSVNCLDRHLADRGDKTALIWEGEPGDTVRLTYRELHAEVCRFANVLRGQGIVAGDPLFILYTSGTTGKAEGHRAHHGRLSAGRHLTTKYVFDLQATTTSTGARPTSAGSRATATWSTARSPTAPPR
jgi:hypothetical protein